MSAFRLCLRVILLVGWVALPTVRAQDSTGERPPDYLRNLRRGDDGALWGMVPLVYAGNGPYHLENGRWGTVPVVGLPEKSRPLCQTIRADGAIVCLWENGNERRVFSVQRGQEYALTATVTLGVPAPAFFENQRLFADSKNNVWFTGGSPEIYRLASDGHADCLHVIQPAECQDRGRPASSQGGNWNTVSACEDGQGHVWFYTDGNVYNSASLRGALVFDGKEFALHDLAAPGQPPPHVGIIAQKDPGHLWVGTNEDGLCTVDTATFARERLPDQPPEARWTQVIFQRGGGWLFVCGPVGFSHADSLWRLRDDHWEKLLDRVDANPFSAPHLNDRLWVRTAGGNFLGSIGYGLWFLPDDGPPKSLDWRRSFPLATPHELAPLPDGHRWLCVDANGKSWIGDPAALLAGPNPPDNPRLHLESAREIFAPDRRRHLWDGLAGGPQVLREWDGERWIAHDPPPETALPEGYRALMGVDNLQRIWLRVESGAKRPIFIYEPVRDRWQGFEDFEKALEAQVALGRDAEPPNVRNPFDLARFGPDGQICYFTRQSRVAWFDGREWHRWNRDEVAGKGARASFDGPPFFSAGGRLRVNVGKQTFEYAGDAGWRPVPEHEVGYADYEVRSAASQRSEVPLAAAAHNPESTAIDSEGACWFTLQGNLYRCRGGLCVPIFRSGEAQPFVDRRRVADALIDARGNAFLHTDERMEYVVVAPPGPPPRTALALAPADAGAPADRVQVRLSGDAGPVDGKMRYEWRLDGGAWQAVAAEASPTTVPLDGLPGGTHRFEARSFDAFLQTDPTPAALTIEVRVNPAAQIAGYIVQLTDPDYSRRKAAVFALARQPELALPALQTARIQAGADQRWWIDAALTEIAATQKTKPSTPDKLP